MCLHVYVCVCVCVYFVFHNVHCFVLCEVVVWNGDAISQETAPIRPFLINWPNHCCGNNYKG